MFERFTERARRVIFFARAEAGAAASSFIEPEHLLLGILRENKGVFEKLLLPGSRFERLVEELRGEPTRRAAIPVTVDLPLSETSKQILHQASQQAEGLSHRHIGVEHLLLSVLGNTNNTAAMVLQKYGLDRDRLWAEVAHGRIVDPEAPDDRAHLHSLVDSLPEHAVEEADALLANLQEHRRTHTSSGATLQAGVSSSRVEHGVTVVETRRFYRGHEIVMVERFFLSDDETKLNYVQDVKGPKQEHRQEFEFDLT